ncbi:hypothetical protein A3I46_01755 [Candidatus Kaiserbacteria bacterium RIFCSPLOWO2_02_FULL_54_13]|uniref:Serine protease n=1 Tax=Candidatus Kaiserbacteria bacterium RIFCSPHIGHO2_02_FULL_54_22 TaxID=1798495 RepID=A0A1F6DN43_9BACT|nr:MAG: hypothetical protein UY89_C0031G0008 [Parcubacteria group bacterium GW2011_GWA1_54_9]KKW41893.1 MAG: hypothetical protein UY91_C0010G0020 [Parcubacteria group bacterium GW2011_GWB1_55_9]OGG62881.1 MAG: hypothetical protein A3C19_02005 [Candidatus Kaiserbacteria bacterium RIFCSPHIGHO2_02_FULL_54_22]OGG68066.1 MAG: hypothetical protein A3E99_02220 [Candidatus Kaiserbacteria bacterium RIFCSPHIGHO2_12_FULL_54_16]OGG82545.1 MAG: hypothetical protein A3I46_01755 [Candidatus Kaiserbacteria bac
MNIEELSKSQLVLLTILVNFVTSVATGILTVSLLDTAPPYVTQTVNRVVERTIETVAAAAPATIIQAPAPSNQDLVTAALGVAATRAVVIYAAETGTSTPSISVGTYLPKSRAVATAAQGALPREALIGFPGDIYIFASIAHEGDGVAIYGFADDATLPKATSPTLIATSDLKLGQTTLAIGADGSASTGIVARVSDDGVHTTLPDIGAGSAAVDLSGNLVGIGAGITPGLLIPTNKITTLLTTAST